nr:hypothetical protein [uncultured Flavobacterium sp.]
MAKLLKLKNLNNIILLLLLLVSCNDDKKNKYVIHKYDDGTYLKSNYFLENNDTVLNGKCSIFYSNNKLKISSELYRNEINGKVNYYGIDGLLDSIKYIVNNKEIGETYWYHKNGNIFKYNFYDDLNNAECHRILCIDRK